MGRYQPLQSSAPIRSLELAAHPFPPSPFMLTGCNAPNPRFPYGPPYLNTRHHHHDTHHHSHISSLPSGCWELWSDGICILLEHAHSPYKTLTPLNDYRWFLENESFFFQWSEHGESSVNGCFSPGVLHESAVQEGSQPAEELRAGGVGRTGVSPGGQVSTVPAKGFGWRVPPAQQGSEWPRQK